MVGSAGWGDTKAAPHTTTTLVHEQQQVGWAITDTMASATLAAEFTYQPDFPGHHTNKPRLSVFIVSAYERILNVCYCNIFYSYYLQQSRGCRIPWGLLERRRWQGHPIRIFIISCRL